MKIGSKLVCPMSTPSGYSSVATDPEQAVHFDSMQLNNSVIPVCVESGKVETRTMRKWRQFPGRNQFYCDGRLMLGRGLGLFYLTCFLIVVPTLLFLAFEYVLLLAVYRGVNDASALSHRPLATVDVFELLSVIYRKSTIVIFQHLRCPY